MKKFVKYLSYAFRFSAIGVFIGLIISLIINYLGNPDSSCFPLYYYPSTPTFISNFSSPLTAFTVSILLWALIGMVFGFGSFIFAIKKWSLLKKTLVNFIVNYLGFTLLATLAGWGPSDWVTLLVFTGEFAIIYLVSWSFSYWQISKEIREINQKIKKKKELRGNKKLSI